MLKHCGMRMEDGTYVRTSPIHPHIITTRARMSASTFGIDRIDIAINFRECSKTRTQYTDILGPSQKQSVSILQGYIARQKHGISTDSFNSEPERERYKNSELKPSAHLVGHRLTVQTQRTRRLTRVFTFCLENNLLEFDPNGCKNIPLNTSKHSLNGNALLFANIRFEISSLYGHDGAVFHYAHLSLGHRTSWGSTSKSSSETHTEAIETGPAVSCNMVIPD